MIQNAMQLGRCWLKASLESSPCSTARAGMPRTVIDIERAAQLCVKEGPLRFAPYENRPDRSLAAETDEAEGGR